MKMRSMREGIRSFSGGFLQKTAILFGLVLSPLAFAEGSTFTNSLGMVFAPVSQTNVLFSIWATRVQDFEVFVKATGYDATERMYSDGSDGWKQRGASWKSPGFEQGPTHPVCGVDWQDSKAFCQWLTEKERKEGVITQKQTYRLPQDAEWSLAVGLPEENGQTPKEKSAKIKGVYPWGTQWPPSQGAGNYAGDEARTTNWPSRWATIKGYQDGFARTAPVGSFKANIYGLYDMGGNVWQWCEDLFDNESIARVLRGGSWYNSNADHLLSSYRNFSALDFRRNLIGFRVVLDGPGKERGK